MAEDIRAWLDAIGLGRYAPAFVENEIAVEDLALLDEADLERLGLPMGPRKRLLSSITGGGVLARAMADETSAAAPVRGEAERRRLTVMFVDLVGSTRLSAGLDPEELGGVIAAFQSVVAGAVSRFDGQVAKYMGDGALCCFGWPDAHEDDPERAVRAGLRILEGLSDVAAPGGKSLAARIGVATGLVVVGDVVGEGAAREEALVGDTPNLAARLQEAAAPGALLVSEATRELLRDAFTTEPLAPMRLKGWEAPVQAHRVLGEVSAESRYAVRAGAAAMTIGRDAETMLLSDRWRRARRGEGQIVLLRGEAGIGKSALVFDFAERLRGEPHVRIVYSTSPHHASTALWPVIAQLGRAAGLESADGPAERRAKLAEMLRAGDREDPLDLAVICDLVGVEPPADAGLELLAPRQRRARVFRLLGRMFETLNAEAPVLMILEDLQWIDPTSAELFEEVAGQVRRLRAMLVVTMRAEAPEPLWAGLPHATSMSLGRLSLEEAEKLAERVAGGRALTPAVRRAILERTEGVPLFVEEMTKNLLERTGEAADVAESAIPVTLHDSLMARLDRLGPARRVAQVAACLGRDADEAILVEVFDGPKAEVARGIDALLASELAFHVSSEGARRLRFKHAMVRDVAYESLLKGRRREIHGRIADALLARSEAAGPEILARHLDLADRPREAAEAWRRASERAFERSAMHEARAHLEAAVVRLRAGPEDEDAARLELELLGPLGVAIINTRGPASPDAEAVHRRATELAERLGDAAGAFRARWARWRVRNASGEMGSAASLSRELLNGLPPDAPPEHMLQAHHACWSNAVYVGDLQGTVDHVDAALALHDPERMAETAMRFGGHDACECGLTQRGLALFVSGRITDGLASNRAGVSRAAEVGTPQVMAHAFNWTLLTLQSSGDLEELERRGRVLRDLVFEYGLEIYATEADMVLSWLAARRERDPRHVEALHASLDRRHAMGTRFVGTYFRHLVADAWLALGRHDEASTAIELAIADADARGERLWYAELLRVRARIDLAVGERPREEIERDLRAAAEDADARGALTWRLRATTDLARLMAERGERSEAREELATVLDRFAAEPATDDLTRARETLAELS